MKRIAILLVLLNPTCRPSREAEPSPSPEAWVYLVVDVDCSPECRKAAGLYLSLDGKKMPLPVVFRAKNSIGWSREYDDNRKFKVNGQTVTLEAEKREYLDKITGERNHGGPDLNLTERDVRAALVSSRIFEVADDPWRKPGAESKRPRQAICPNAVVTVSPGKADPLPPPKESPAKADGAMP